MGSNVESTQSAAPALLALSAQSTLVQITLCSVGTSCDGMTPAPRVQPVEPVAGNPHGGFCEGGQAQAASTASPVPTHHKIVRGILIEMVEKRVSDGSVLRLIQKWIKVGVIEDGELLMSETGTGQGQPISPLLANIYLHHALDVWFDEVVKPRLKGEAYEFRFADDGAPRRREGGFMN